MKWLIIIISFLGVTNIQAQETYFNFVEGWFNSFSFESDNRYLMFGVKGINGGGMLHEHYINEINLEGEITDTLTFQVTDVESTSLRSNAYTSVKMTDSTYILVGTYAVHFSPDTIYGALYEYNINQKVTNLIYSEDIDSHTIYYCAEHPNDSTLIVGASYYNGYEVIGRVDVKNFNGESRWFLDFECGDDCKVRPEQVLTLSNGNIAFLYRELDDWSLGPFFDHRERAKLAVLNQAGDLLWERNIGDHENHRIWANSMIEIDGEILVPYSQPYYYDENGEWHANFDNTVYLEKYDMDGVNTSFIDLTDDVPDSESEFHTLFYRITQMQLLPDGNYLLSGTGGWYGMLLKISPSGEVIWYSMVAPHTYEENQVGNYTRIYHTLQTSDGGFLCTGEYWSDPGDVYPEYVQTAFALKVDEYGCLEEDCQVGIMEIEQQKLSVYPNPSDGVFNISLPENEANDLSVYNATGKLIKNEKSIRKKNYALDISPFAEGIYIINVQSESGGRYFSKIVKR